MLNVDLGISEWNAACAVGAWLMLCCNLPETKATTSVYKNHNI